MHKIDRQPSYGPTRYAEDSRLERFVVSSAVDAWIYRYRTPGRRSAGVSSQLEIGAQLEGSWRQRGALRGDGLYEQGQVHVLNPGEAYDLAFHDAGLVLGLTVDVDRLCGTDEAARELRVVGRDATAMRTMFELCCFVLEQRRSGRGNAADEVDAILRRWVWRWCEPTAPDAAIAARRELERHYAHDLYLRHVAETVGLAPETLLRRFAKRYGITPIQYRLRLRLNAAARRGWLEPERPLREIAEDVGIPNLSYFHRAYRGYFGVPPSLHRRDRLDSI